MTETSQSEISQQTVGQLLLSARQQQQLSAAAIAEQMKLKVTVIHALENDEVIPGTAPTFVKGYIRAYAKLLGLDAESLVAQYQLANQDDPKAKTAMTSFSRKVARDNRDSRWMLVTYAVVLVLVVLVVIWWYQQTSDARFPISERAPESSPVAPISSEIDNQAVPTSDVTTDAAQISTQAISQAVTPVSEIVDAVSENASIEPESDFANDVDTPALSAADLDTSGSAEANLDAADDDDAVADFVAPPPVTSRIETVMNALENSDPDTDEPLLDSLLTEGASSLSESATSELVFTFEQDCWVKVTDATGNDVAYGVKKAGRVMPVRGVAPFAVVLGAPQGVSIEINGSPVDISGLPTNRTARFSVPLEVE